MILILNTLE
ncbi:hypothetical protein CJF31_00001018 [Rutstroemia sp. NJR-2017a BVV2]|nr:hypothetical protein CJF32_00002174 [Rutstroemia sp. NJR-2017a WRK4]PQE11230.1 hypothetical protein CJF31_00001018 [Rutstroemia sp. NJR-2017a BVV2]PQE14858.1 hypothetical protein CJF32_00002385 [Rutstroemia sp. NJR-2017a WRK4]